MTTVLAIDVYLNNVVKNLMYENIIRELNENKAIILPTETVYGIASFNDTLLFQLKKRPYDVKLPIMYSSVERLLVDITSNYYQQRAIMSLAPGPFTFLVYDKNMQKVAVRIPEHNICLTILDKLDKPLFVTSANAHGQLPATSFAQAKEYFPYLLGLDCGECIYKKSSMIIDLTGDRA